VIVKTYTAPDLEKALWLLGEDLGPAATILRTRFANAASNPNHPIKFVEIIAALESSLLGRQDLQCQPQKSIKSSNRIKRTKKAGVSKREISTENYPDFLEVVGW
jgi:hypothetical protein